MRNAPPGIQTMLSAGGREGAETGIASCVAISVTSPCHLRADVSRHPCSGDPVNRTAKDQIGNERERQNDDYELQRMDSMEYEQLVHDVHHHAERDHACHGLSTLSQQFPSLAWPREDRPEVRRPTLTRVNDAVSRGIDQRHRWLHEESKRKRAV